jgi:rhamnose utilization protein RhaD (predicted bifunctional aldolase and dehydrogenase)
MSSDELEIVSLLELSGRLGRNPCLVQAANGNISIKIGGVIWVKASGKWLVNGGREEILVPVDLAAARAAIDRGTDPSADYITSSGSHLRASIETAMHVVLPHRVVIHVHSVATIALAVRQDGRARISERLEGLRWAWIPYVPSGLPLAHAIESAREAVPGVQVLILGNHGLVVGGESCEAANDLLSEVEMRLATPARACSNPDFGHMAKILDGRCWRIPENPVIQGLAMDPVTRAVATNGVLYPCQAIFLGSNNPVLECPRGFSEAVRQIDPPYGSSHKFLIVPDAGVIVNDRFTRTEYEMLLGLAEVARRVEPSARLRYLTQAEVSTLLNVDAYQYRSLVERNDETAGTLAASGGS